MKKWKLIEDYLMIYSGIKYKKPIDEHDEMSKISNLGKSARKCFCELGEKAFNQISDFTMCKCSSWVNMNQSIPNYLWIQFKKKGFEKCPSSISLAAKKVKDKIYLYVAVEIKDQSANDKDFENHNKILTIPLIDDKLYYSANDDNFFYMGTDVSYVDKLIKNKTIKKVRIQGNVESSIDIDEEEVIENIVKLIKTLQPYYDNIIENWGSTMSQEQLNRNSNNTKLNQITEWIISCNPSYYDVIGAFNELECIEWKQSTNIKAGDIIYIYVSSPVKEIKYKCIARKVNLSFAVRTDDLKFMIDDSNYKNYGRYMELELITKYQDKQYTLDDLKQHGLRSVQGPSKLSEDLKNYIKLIEISKIKEIKESLKSKHNLEADINEIKVVELKEFYDYKHEKKKKQKPKVQDGMKIYPRDRNVAMNALLHASYKCEVNQNHPTFIRKNLDINYTESHHLVPMAYSDLFDVSLDVEENIVSLCSNCHNLLHYGRDFRDVLKELYNERKEHLNNVGIDITFEQLLNMYL